MAKKKSKAPKKWGGLKIPKAYRKAINRARKVGASPIAREVAAAALIAVASGLMNTKGSKKARAVVGKASDGAPRLADETNDLLSRVGNAIGDAIISGIQRLFADDNEHKVSAKGALL